MRAIFMMGVLVCACSSNRIDSAALRQERLNSTTWHRVASNIGEGSGALTKVDRFTTSAESGRAILLNIEDPELREQALRSWEREVQRALPSITQERHRASVRSMLEERELLTTAGAKVAQEAKQGGAR